MSWTNQKTQTASQTLTLTKTGPIIVFKGPAGAGKTTSMNMFCKLIREPCVSLTFAGPLKSMCSDLYGAAYGIDDIHFYGPAVKKNEIIPELGVSGRHILQNVGTEGFRAVTPKLWSDLLVSRCKGIFKGTAETFICIDDMRFLSEDAAVREYCKSIKCLYFVVDIFGRSADTRQHSSEEEHQYIRSTHSLDNSSTLSRLKNNVERLKEDIHKQWINHQNQRY